MNLHMNSLGEFSNPDDFEPPKRLKLRHEEDSGIGNDTRKCAECGKEFTPRNRMQRFCCRNCRARNERREK